MKHNGKKYLLLIVMAVTFACTACSGKTETGKGDENIAASAVEKETSVKKEASVSEKSETDEESTAAEKVGSQQKVDAGTPVILGQALEVGNHAPEFTAKLTDGTELALTDLRGKPVLINLWATWCGPCVREMPAFERLWEEFGDEIGIIAVNCGDDTETVTEFAEEYGYTFPIALDENLTISMMYPTNGIPYTVIVDEYGKITHISSGASDADTMYERYKEALGL